MGRSLAAALLFALVALAASPSRAVVVPDLYTLTVMPDPEAPDARASAIDNAMRQLLTRITGDREAGADPELAGLIENAARYVSSFAMLDRQRAQVGFYATEVDRELAALGRPVWGPERPLTLLWVAIDGGLGERLLLSAEGVPGGLSPEMTALAESVRAEIEAVAEERGVPVALPLLDIEDLSRVSFADVWGGFDETVQEASTRYGADAILIARVRATPFGNSVQWTLVRNEDRRSFSAGDVTQGLHWLADTYAQDFAVLGDVGTVRIVVRDVQSFTDYGRVMSYLEGLSTLQSIDVESYDGGLLSLRAVARGEVDVLERMLGLGRVLELDSNASPDGAGNTLVLRVARGGR